MAVVLDQINIATYQAFDKSVLNRELLSQDCAALRMLQENAVRAEGDPINVKVRYKRNNGGEYSGYDRMNTDQVEQLAEGSLEWKGYYVNVTIDEQTMVRNASMNIADLMSVKSLKSLPANGKAILNIVGEAMVGAMDDMKHLLAEALWQTTPGAKDMDSIPNIVNLTSTYASIAYDSLNTFDYVGLTSGSNDNIWAGRVSSNSGTNRSLDEDILQQVIDDCSIGADTPKWAFCGRDAYRALTLLLEGAKTRPNAAVSEIGFTKHIEWADYGVTFLRDEYCDRNEIYIINPKHLKLFIHPKLDMVFSGFKEPTDQAALTGQLKCMVQLWCDDRAKQGLVDDVTV